MDGTSSKISDYNGIILDMILRIRFNNNGYYIKDTTQLYLMDIILRIRCNNNGYYIKDTMQWMGPVARWLTTEEQMTGDSSLR